MYEGKEVMQEKEHVAVYGATCATTLNLPSDINGTGRIVIADSWYGIVKTVIALKESGLSSVRLVKWFPQESLDSHDFTVGMWVAYSANLDGDELQAVNFQELKNHTHVKKVGHNSEFLFGIYWWTWKTNNY